MDLWLSLGSSRKSKTWKNQKFSWPELLAKLRYCHYTGETVAQYAGMTVGEQAVIKDIGGFVGGTITGGRRKKGSVGSRSILTLDLDNAPQDFWAEYTLSFSWAAAIYSTHKHTPGAPRLRLIIPLTCEILADQYQALSRWVAGEIGMSYVDPVSFRVEQLMYWPSMPKDGEYVFESFDGAWLDPVGTLEAAYHDWKDSSQWPLHPSEAKEVRESVKMAQDPTEKTGIVGAFCRVYGIEEAISEYLGDQYEPAGEGRYTYTGGSTAAGLVVYDNKFAYSHHGTDPVSGILVNSFDLVRVHKYGKLDERCHEDTPINKRPSYAAMCDLARADKEVNLDIVKQQTSRAVEAFNGVDVPGGEGPGVAGEGDQWLKTLETDRKGKIAATAENLMIILRNDPNLAGKFGRNEFTGWDMSLGGLPWDDREIFRPWDDPDDAGLRWYIETTYGITSAGKVSDCLTLSMLEGSYHPVREYLEALTWDGEPRVERLLIDYLGAADTEYVRAVTRKMLVGAVGRIFQPGIKFDNLIVLIGEEGAAKSQFIKSLANEWFSESFGRLDSKEAAENLQGVWLMEIPELAAFKGAEVETIKHFLSKQYDDFRPAYGRRVARHPRQCIFIGTSNNLAVIKGHTGGRRFWPVVITKDPYFKGRVFNELPKLRKQIWAEAVKLWADGEDLHLPEYLEDIAHEIQARHTEADPWADMIQEYLDTPVPVRWDDMSFFDRRAFLNGDETQPKGEILRNKITGREIWLECIEGDRKGFTTAYGRRIASILRELGWIEVNKTWADGVAQRTYQRLKIEENDDL